MLDALRTSSRIRDHYLRYLRSTFAPRQRAIAAEFDAALKGEFRLSKGPFLQASPPFHHGASIRDLVEEGVLAEGFLRLPPESFPIDRPLYRHQEHAIRKAIDGRSLVIATGTGSGKTECFLIPIVNHLLREQEAGTLKHPGVRALLLYPMNALANDQVKRLRTLLAHLPGLTFGRYVGDTPSKEKEAVVDFRARFPGTARLANELLSREVMQDAPPSILLTNFAMLEYLLLRPADSAMFEGVDGQHWRFVVLDEAHVYDGAQGTEIAMLLRRVKDRVVESEQGRLQCFATSATLGRGVADHPALITFATDLFGEDFAADPGAGTSYDIVEADRKEMVRGSARYELPQNVYAPLRDAFRSGALTGGLVEVVVQAEPTIPLPSGELAPQSWLAELLSGDARTVGLQQLLGRGAADISAPIEGFSGPTRDGDLVALVDLANAARHGSDDAPVLPARYHFFLRALEGAYLCLHPRHPVGTARLSMGRRERCPNCARTHQAAMFELGLCRSCGAEYLLGTQRDDRPLQQPTTLGSYSYFLLADSALSPEEEDEDEQAAVEDEADRDRRYICPSCAVVSEKRGRCGCEGDRPDPVEVVRVTPKRDAEALHSCPACGSRSAGEIVYRFQTGVDAPVAVVATDLYQELPASTEVVSRPGQGRKLLTFSDSRQDAAFFASFLERTYGAAIQRRLLADAVFSFSDEMPRSGDLVSRLKRRVEDEGLLGDLGSVAIRDEVSRWVQRELVAIDRRQSLDGTATAEISIAIPRGYEAPPRLLQLGFTAAEATDTLILLLDSLRTAGAVGALEGVDLRHEIFSPRNMPIAVRASESDRHLLAWVPNRGSNRRVDLLRRVFQSIGCVEDPVSILNSVWPWLTTNDVWRGTFLVTNDKEHGIVHALNPEKFEFRQASDGHLAHVCDTCRRVSWRNVRSVCPTYRCGGSLSPLALGDERSGDHYARLYRELRPIGMAVEEHTAQWNSKKAGELQEEFVRGDINVLSCSTTFELGVDVGEVQAVLLRNVPPSPANYVQRAGRAGRRTDAAALVVTFAQRRSHDLTWFGSPETMVDGYVRPPHIMLDNPFIARRHAHAVAFAAFQRQVVAAGSPELKKCGDFFLPDTDAPVGDFVSWLRTRPVALGDALRRILPPSIGSELRLDDWGWVEDLVERRVEDPSCGWLDRATTEMRSEHGAIEEKVEHLKEENQLGRAAQLLRVKRTLEQRDLLGYLASRNVLPKYGFPVEVVELDLGRTGDATADNLELSRDMKQAIREYAPGAEVVAGRKLWTSAGLVVRPDKDWLSYKWATCDKCGAFASAIGDLSEECPACATPDWKSKNQGVFIIPEFGFVGRSSGTRPGETRPPSGGSTESYFGAYIDAEPEWAPVQGVAADLELRARFGRQGKITVIARGVGGTGFNICFRCGYAERSGTGKKTKHDDIRRVGTSKATKCEAKLVWRQLGHSYLTDVLELSTAYPMSTDAAWSVLYALLEGSRELGIRRDDIDGSVVWSRDQGTALVIFDSVPGGAGHALRLGQSVPQLMAAALQIASECECGSETSCYQCLRSYSNQIRHNVLKRGLAQEVLEAHSA